MRDLPRPGQVYRHFKGNIYRIITVAVHSETGEQLVIYKRDDAEEKSYARPLDMFMSEVDRKKYPDVRDRYRFTLCTDDDLSDLAAGGADASTEGLDPLLEAFLDARTVSDKIDRLYDMKKTATDEILGYVAASLDIDVKGDTQEKFSEILRALKAREKYESSRLRG
ncbi:MAG: DUF1653 domain-containing protein [Lachnospiraceae bacterium]|nr:DUF1653 domain-containing protein [Lachnospiraceae bacterium]